MQRTPPAPSTHAIRLYVNTYYSLLRSSGEVRVRAFEEAHAFCGSSLHEGALAATPDLSAFAYAAGRLPDEMRDVSRVILGQSHELFEAEGYFVREWDIVKTRGRRRPLRFDGSHQLAVYIASASDIDDLIPIVTAYQIEWNKLHALLATSGATEDAVAAAASSPGDLAELIATSEADAARLIDALGKKSAERGLRAIFRREMNLSVRMLSASFSQYQRAAQRWWSGVEPTYIDRRRESIVPGVARTPRRAPVYFVSSNTHAIANLIGGYALAHKAEVIDWALKTNPEGLGDAVKAAAGQSDEALAPLLYYLLRSYIHHTTAAGQTSGASSANVDRLKGVRAFEATKGLLHLSEPGHIDVDAQIATLSELDPACLDPRLRIPGIERLRASDAVLVNIDYPLGMAAYHLLSRVGQGVGEIRGVYVMGKAATLNGRVGDVMVSGVVYDEHSRNTFLLKNAFSSRDVSPYLQHGSVFDSQKAVTVLSAFLQSKDYMDAFYQSGYTVLEMEAGPFLSSIYELVNPKRVPSDEIVHLSAHTSFDVGILHYASDTPYSRRQSLLSKSLSFFGVDSTYACAIAIMRRIFELELARIDGA